MSPPSPNQFAYQRSLQQRSTPDVGTMWRWVGRDDAGQAVIENPRGQRVTARLTGNAAIAPGTPVLYVPPEPGQGFGVVQLPTVATTTQRRRPSVSPRAQVFVVGDITWWNVERGWDDDGNKARFMSAMLLSSGINRMFCDSMTPSTGNRLSVASVAYIESLGIQVIRTPIEDWRGFAFIEANDDIRYSPAQESSILANFVSFGGIISVDIGRVSLGTNAYIASLFGFSIIEGDPNTARDNDWKFNSSHPIFTSRPTPNALGVGGVSSGFDKEENQISSVDVIATSTRTGFEGTVQAYTIPRYRRPN